MEQSKSEGSLQSCLYNWSVNDSVVLMSAIIILAATNCYFMSISFYFKKLSISTSGTLYIYNYYIFLMKVSLS
jgi:hypothetical protein